MDMNDMDMLILSLTLRPLSRRFFFVIAIVILLIFIFDIPDIYNDNGMSLRE